jgi:hypothetical protein
MISGVKLEKKPRISAAEEAAAESLGYQIFGIDDNINEKNRTRKKNELPFIVIERLHRISDPEVKEATKQDFLEILSIEKRIRERLKEYLQRNR